MNNASSVWREGSSSEIGTIQYTRHIFGAKPSSTWANFLVHQTACDNVKRFPVASNAVFTSACVGAFLKPVPCESDAVALVSHLIKIITEIGFN